MTHTEGMPEGANGSEEMRGSHMRAIEYQDARKEEMDRLATEYRNVQMQMDTLRADIKKGTEHVIRENNPQMEKLGLQIRQQIQDQINDLEIRKEELESQIRGKGGNPDDYLVQ